MRNCAILRKKNEKKSAHFLGWTRKKRTKKTSTPPNWDNVEEKIKEKYI